MVPRVCDVTVTLYRFGHAGTNALTSAFESKFEMLSASVPAISTFSALVLPFTAG